MKTVGLIVEYNPFHNGHLYHIQKAKEITGADEVVVVMSGDFVQRGTPAIMPKHIRTEMALQAGASVVFELPVCYATGSARYFAMGGISLLHHLGCVDYFCFGSECGTLEPLERIANILLQEPAEFQAKLQLYIKAGLTFPMARQEAMRSILGDDRTAISLLEDPNNILGIEYLRALKELQSTMIPYTIKRKHSHYHNMKLQDGFSSASAIRNLLVHTAESYHTMDQTTHHYTSTSQVLSSLEGQVPSWCITLLRDTHGIRYPVHTNDFSLMLRYQLLQETKDSLRYYMGMNEDIANRIINQRNHFINFEQFCELIKTKDTTYTRVSRALLSVLLKTYQKDMEIYTTNGYHFYAHMLGFKKSHQGLLREMKHHSSIPLLSKVSNHKDIHPYGQQMLENDLYAADLYESVISDRFKTSFINEKEQSIVMI